MKVYELDKKAYRSMNKDYAEIFKLALQGKALREFENKQIENSASDAKLHEVNLAKIVCGFYRNKFCSIRNDEIPFVIDYAMSQFKDFAKELNSVCNQAYVSYEGNKETSLSLGKFSDMTKLMNLACKYDGDYEKVKEEFHGELDEEFIKKFVTNVEKDKFLDISIFIDSFNYFSEMTDEELAYVDFTKYSAKALLSLQVVYSERIKTAQNPYFIEDLEFMNEKLKKYISLIMKYSSMSLRELLAVKENALDDMEAYVYRKTVDEKSGNIEISLNWKEDEFEL